MAGIVGRPPNPVAMKQITGHANGRPIAGILTAERIDPPPHLNGPAKDEWHRLAPILTKRGLLLEEETAALALYCQAYGRWQQAEQRLAEMAAAGTGDGLLVKAPSGYPIQNPYLAIANKAMEQCYQFLQQFGLSPSARARISVAQLDLFEDERETKSGYFN